jgi:hypothetical protein
MFELCPKTDTHCCFCGKSRFNPAIGESDNITRLFCGVAKGYDGRVNSLPKCWFKMSKNEKAKYVKIKNVEYETMLNSGKFK